MYDLLSKDRFENQQSQNKCNNMKSIDTSIDSTSIAQNSQEFGVSRMIKIHFFKICVEFYEHSIAVDIFLVVSAICLAQAEEVRKSERNLKHL